MQASHLTRQNFDHSPGEPLKPAVFDDAKLSVGAALRLKNNLSIGLARNSEQPLIFNPFEIGVAWHFSETISAASGPNWRMSRACPRSAS